MKLLDTNVVIGIVNDRTPGVRARFSSELRSGEQIALPVIALFELRFGIAKSRQRNFNEDMLEEFLAAPMSVIDFDEASAAHAGAIRATLESAGTPIGPYDLLIAAQALRHGATLVTANTREFARVPGLKVENWGD